MFTPICFVPSSIFLPWPWIYGLTSWNFGGPKDAGQWAGRKPAPWALHQQSATPGLDSQPPSFYVEQKESLSVLKSCYFRFLLLTVKSSSNWYHPLLVFHWDTGSLRKGPGCSVGVGAPGLPPTPDLLQPQKPLRYFCVKRRPRICGADVITSQCYGTLQIIELFPSPGVQDLGAGVHSGVALPTLTLQLGKQGSLERNRSSKHLRAGGRSLSSSRLTILSAVSEVASILISEHPQGSAQMGMVGGGVARWAWLSGQSPLLQPHQAEQLLLSVTIRISKASFFEKVGIWW